MEVNSFSATGACRLQILWKGFMKPFGIPKIFMSVSELWAPLICTIYRLKYWDTWSLEVAPSCSYNSFHTCCYKTTDCCDVMCWALIEQCLRPVPHLVLVRALKRRLPVLALKASSSCGLWAPHTLCCKIVSYCCPVSTHPHLTGFQKEESC